MERRLPIEIFGRILIETGDLDPIYIALHRTFSERSNNPSLARWLVAYWCFYHAGFACYASEQPDFWETMLTAARNEVSAPNGERWPRGSERRHFRGEQGMRAVAELAARYPGQDGPNRMVSYIRGCLPQGRDTIPCGDIIARVKEHRGFGDWISFKVADMMETNVGVPVSFDNGTIFMFDTPVKGARAACDAWGESLRLSTDKQRCDYAVERLYSYFSGAHGMKAAPRYDRSIQIQEIETVLCKWKSHLGGHYPIGKDSREIAHGLSTWAKQSYCGQVFAAALPTFEVPSWAEEMV